MFGLAYVGKAVCLDGEQGFWGRTRYCYSDVRVLWDQRGFDADVVPYTAPPPGYEPDYTLEYPPGLAFPAWMIAEATDTRAGFFNLHMLTFALAAGVTLWASDRALRAARRDGARRSRWRSLGIALSPALLLVGLQNWDLWAVALVAVGLLAAARRRPYRAAVWWGLAAAVKWWPGLLVLTLLAGPWRPAPDRAGPPAPPGSWIRIGRPALPWLDLRPGFVAAGAWLVVQLPALLAGAGRWWESILFHLRRDANVDSTVAAIERVGSSLWPGGFWGTPYDRVVTVVTLSLLVAGCVVVVRRLRDGRVGPADAALALVGLFLLTGKVFSPQFVVWLLPLAVVATVSWWPVAAVEATNAAVWLFTGPYLGSPDWASAVGFLNGAQATSVLRTLAVAWLVVAALQPRAGGYVPTATRTGRSRPPAASDQVVPASSET